MKIRRFVVGALCVVLLCDIESDGVPCTSRHTPVSCVSFTWGCKKQGPLCSGRVKIWEQDVYIGEAGTSEQTIATESQILCAQSNSCYWQGNPPACAPDTQVTNHTSGGYTVAVSSSCTPSS